MSNLDATYLEVTDRSFERDVIERSFERPVVVDFWAAWCAPCRALGPVLEKLASEADGSWLLAKLDVDANPAIAGAFGIQGIPAVKAFKDGREVAEFVGALPEAQVRAWLSQLGPSPADLAHERGVEAEARADLEQARAEYEEALRHDPGHRDAQSGLARVGLSLRSRGIDEGELHARLSSNPADVDAATALADARAASGEFEAAFEVLLTAVRLNDGDERELARRHLVSLLDALPPGDARATAARRRLAAMLF